MGGGTLLTSFVTSVKDATVTEHMVFQFKIELRFTKPKIWRRIQVPGDYDFAAFHEAILDSMGWNGTHSHHFEIKNPKTNRDEILKPVDNRDVVLNNITVFEEEAKIADYFVSPRNKALYTYDFGSEWEHEVVLEMIFPSVAGTRYPKCIGGELARPPEECGGVLRYYELLEAFKNPSNPGHIESFKWFDPDFDPNHFDPDSVF